MTLTWNKWKTGIILGLSAVMMLGSIVSVKAAEVGNKQTDAEVKFKAGKIIDPDPGPSDGGGEEDPEPPFPPTGSDDLKLVYAPSLDFGEVQVTTEAKDYYAKAQYVRNTAGGSNRYVVNYMKVIDVRGNNAGWNVKVKMDGAFTATDSLAVTKTLTGTSITFENSVLQTESAALVNTVKGYGNDAVISADSGEYTIMQAPQGAGSGIWYQEFGTNRGLVSANSDGEIFKENGLDLLFNPNIKLNVPAGIMPDSVKYSTELVWTLSNTP